MANAQTVAAIQMVSTSDIDDNLNQASLLLARAAEQGARVAVLPENFAVLDTANMPLHGSREVSAEGPIRSFLAEQARKHGLWIVGGSLPIGARPDGSTIDDRVRASCVVVDDQGLVTVETPVGRLGLSICYDLRFPEMFRQLREKEIDWVTLPSAFTWHTGDAHWHPLVRARAIENQVWIVAPGQGGQNSERRRTYGHSMIVDPWGKVLKELAEGAGVVVADLDPDYLKKVRTRMPVWEHRRL